MARFAFRVLMEQCARQEHRAGEGSSLRQRRRDLERALLLHKLGSARIVVDRLWEGQLRAGREETSKKNSQPLRSDAACPPRQCHVIGADCERVVLRLQLELEARDFGFDFADARLKHTERTHMMSNRPGHSAVATRRTQSCVRLTTSGSWMLICSWPFVTVMLYTGATTHKTQRESREVGEQSNRSLESIA